VDDLMTVSANGIQIACRVTGTASAPPLVLLHGLELDSTSWAAVAAALSESWHIFAPDLRGHGLSEAPGDYSFELMRDDVLALLDALGLEQVTLIGHSMGAFVSYLVAEERPELVVRMVLEEPPPPLPAEPPREVPESPDEPASYDWEVLRGINSERNDPDPVWFDRLIKITCPTLVIAGGPASHLPQDQIAAMADRIPDGELVTVPAGHEVHKDDLPGFLKVLGTFLYRAG
jgi:pimeloyl-ACP methyl ester carboxylesterase